MTTADRREDRKEMITKKTFVRKVNYKLKSFSSVELPSVTPMGKGLLLNLRGFENLGGFRVYNEITFLDCLTS